MTTYEGGYLLFIYLQSSLREYVYKRVQKTLETLFRGCEEKRWESEKVQIINYRFLEDVIYNGTGS